MKKKISFMVLLLISTLHSWGQENNTELKKNLKEFVFKTDTFYESKLVTDRAFNLFLQKKSSYFLSGISEISLTRVYTAYSSDNDRFNFGVNFKNINFRNIFKEKDKDKDKQLRWLLTTVFESDLKKNFTTLYKKGKVQSNIRLGFKASIFFGGKITYKGMDHKDNNHEETSMIITRNLELSKILKKINTDSITLTEKKEYCKNSLQIVLDSLDEKASTRKDENTSKYLDLIKRNDSLQNKLIKEELVTETVDDYKTQIALAEVNSLYKSGSHTSFRNYWVSLWGFIPCTETKTYTAINNTENFKPQKLSPWEINIQLNRIWEKSNSVSTYLSAGYKLFKNNSALADLMTPVDYYQYSQFPQTTQSNLALIESNKAYIGAFEKFITHNINLLFVISCSNTKKTGVEKFCTVGLSLYAEQNFGNYQPSNFRIGIPLRLKGKTTPINIEPQVRLNDVFNYKDNIDYKLQPTVGISLGVPFAPLFK